MSPITKIEGTTAFLVMCSTRPDYNAKIHLGVLLSPVAYSIPLSEITPTIRIVFVEASSSIVELLRSNGIYDALPRTEELINLSRSLCTTSNASRTFCLDLGGLFSGDDRVNLVDIDAFIPYFPSGLPVNTFDHITQSYRTGEFRQYDLGTAENLRRYGTTIPPEYNLKYVTAAVAMFWGYNDAITSRTSVSRLASQLPNLIINKAVPDPKFGHIEMYIGDNAYIVVYPYIADLLGEFSKDKGQPPQVGHERRRGRTESDIDVRIDPHANERAELLKTTEEEGRGTAAKEIVEGVLRMLTLPSSKKPPPSDSGRPDSQGKEELSEDEGSKGYEETDL